jgi:hypothetical protein
MFKIFFVILVLIQSIKPDLEVFAFPEMSVREYDKFTQEQNNNQQPSDREISNFINKLIKFGIDGTKMIVDFILRLFGKTFFNQNYFIE